MEEEIKIIEELKKFLSEDITPQFSVEESARALEHLLQAYKEDEAVIEEMAKEIINLDEVGQSKCSGCRNKRKEQKCIECRIEDFRKKVKGEKNNE